MNELKTLKDLKAYDLPLNNKLYEYEQGKQFIKSELKREAIKWIKSNSSYLNDNDGAVENWIKHFFNITKEELK